MSAYALWLFPLLAIIPVTLLLLVRGARRIGGLGLADAQAFAAPARRTSALAGITALVAALLVGFGAVLVHEPDDGISALLPSGESTVVALDMSASVSDLVYDEIARTLALLAETSDDSVRVGLILFSDVAQVALPPGTLPRELKPFVRFFLPKTEASARARPRIYRPFTPSAQLNYIISPWYAGFGSGTAISTGLVAARELIEDAGGGGNVVLISDLDNRATDAPALARELLLYAKSHLSLEVVAVPPAIPAQRELIERVIAGETVIDSRSLRREQGSSGFGGPGLPIAFVLLTAGLALLLAAREPMAASVDLGRATTVDGA